MHSTDSLFESYEFYAQLFDFSNRYFRDGGGELPPDMLVGATESLKKSKVKKKKSSGKDWTWKDQVDMVKWTDRMINVSIPTYFYYYLQLLATTHT